MNAKVLKMRKASSPIAASKIATCTFSNSSPGNNVNKYKSYFCSQSFHVSSRLCAVMFNTDVSWKPE